MHPAAAGPARRSASTAGRGALPLRDHARRAVAAGATQRRCRSAARSRRTARPVGAFCLRSGSAVLPPPRIQPAVPPTPRIVSPAWTANVTPACRTARIRLPGCGAPARATNAPATSTHASCSPSPVHGARESRGSSTRTSTPMRPAWLSATLPQATSAAAPAPCDDRRDAVVRIQERRQVLIRKLTILATHAYNNLRLTPFKPYSSGTVPGEQVRLPASSGRANSFSILGSGGFF